jgi:hypothetical protein
MKKAVRIICAGCVYWNQIKPGSTIGHCRFKPPVVSGYGAIWPTTESEMWCGDGFDGENSFVGNLARLASQTQVTADFEAFTERLSPMHAVIPPAGPDAFGGGGGNERSGVSTTIYKKPEDWGDSSA